MCIIVSKEKGINLPNKEVLKRCFDYNNDGAGLMFVSKGKVNIVKGFMEFNNFYEYIMKLDKIHNLKEKALVMHFRISTGGNVDKGNCHPYPVSPIEKDLRKEYITCNLGMAHNGIIQLYNKKDGVLNDTQQFVRDCVSTVYGLNKEFYKDYKVMKMLEDIAGSKLCFLDANENIYYVGNFFEEDGIKYSNTTYKPYTYFPKRNSYIFDDYCYGYNYGTPTTYYDEVEKKKIKDDLQTSLTREEFEVCVNNLTILDKGTEIIDCFDNYFVVDDENTYGVDIFFNVYYIDWVGEDVYEVYQDCTITYKPFVNDVDDDKGVA